MWSEIKYVVVNIFTVNESFQTMHYYVAGYLHLSYLSKYSLSFTVNANNSKPT